MKIVKIYYAVVVKNVSQLPTVTLHKKIKLSIGDFFSQCDQIHSFLGVWSHLLKKSSIKNFILCEVLVFIISYTLFPLMSATP